MVLRKRAKKSTIASKNVVLKDLVGMPMDIIFEIFGYLDPLDLLQLARTTKALRAILMSRSSSSLWKRVRHAYYQMPDGPEGMSEPQYASLALDHICDSCGLRNAYEVNTYWKAQLKSCYKCKSALLANRSNWNKCNIYPSWLRVFLLKNPTYSLMQAQIWSQEYASFSGSSVNSSLSRKKIKWQRQIKKKNALTKMHIKSFRSWKIARERKMADELLRPMLLSSRYVVLQKFYDEYIRGLPADALIPNIADVALCPPVHAIITDERTDFKVIRQTFVNINLMQTFPSITSDWKIRLDDELIRMVQVKLSEPFAKDQLLLATTVFYCDACHMDLFYPQVLVHQCSPPHRIVVANPLRCPAWNSSGNIKFDRNVHQAAIDIIDILGLDPKAVTAEDMAVRNSVLQCLDCRATRQGRVTMIWSRAIEHSREQHNRLPSMISWKVPGHGGQLTLQARLAQELATLDSVRPRFMCGVCRQKQTLVGLNQHLLSAHDILNPGEHDILFHPDAIHALMPCVLPETD